MSEVRDVPVMPQRAISYKRISFLGKQAKGDGLERQADFAARLCERHGWILDDTLHFTDKGRSGFHGDHRRGKGQLLQFLEMVKAKRITPGTVLIIENLDRLSREELDQAHDLFKSILKAGVWIATEIPERIYTPESLKTLLGTIEPLLHMYVAHEHSLKLSERITDKWNRRRERAREKQQPIGRKCPGWLEWTPTGYRVIPSRAETVRTIFRLAIDGYGLTRIRQWLQARSEEHPAWGWKGVWLKETVGDILRKRKVRGEWQPQKGVNGYHMANEGEPIRGYYPEIVSEEEWQLAQAAIAGRKNAAGRPSEKESNLFTGLVREASSGERMHIKPILGGPKGKKKTYRYLVAARLADDGRASRGFAYQPFEEAILRTVGMLKPRDVLPPSAIKDEREARIGELTSRLVLLDHRCREIAREIEDPENAASVRMLTRSYAKILAEKEDVGRELGELKLKSITGRAEALAETQTILTLVDEVRGTDQEEEVRRRLKTSLGWLVEEIWVVAQKFSQMRMIVHAQVYLRAGGRRYIAYGPYQLRPGEQPWQLQDCDFRAGELPADIVRQAALAAGA